ncbi:hypothetical protein [Streptomyces sp. NPDC091259]|uniref:hypothetical protein n=1 Tax=Streptomyces sp. NPDC091259 TaxID=3365976 RepID=UPI0038084641
MSERTRDERIESYYHESARALAMDLVDAEDEAARLRSAWTSARRRARKHRSWWRGTRHRMLTYRAMLRYAEQTTGEVWADCWAVSDERDRYRSAWLSARGRAVDYFNFGAEALALRDKEIARLKAELSDLRKTFCGADALECVGEEGDGSTVWRLRQ